MTATRDFDDITRAWLDLMPDEAPDRTIAAVIQAVATTPQVRRPIDIFWRPRSMSRWLLGGAMALLVIASGIIVLGPRGQAEVASPSTIPSPTVIASGQFAGPALDDALRAKWVSNAPSNELLRTGNGPVSLTVTSSGTGMGAANFGAGHGYSSVAALVAPDQIAVELERDGEGCRAGARGVYRWSLPGDRSYLRLTTVSDDCPQRAAVFARTWARSLEGSTTVGAGVVDTMEPNFAVTLPDDSWQSRTLDDFIEIGEPDGHSLMAFKNPQTFVDPCSRSMERNPVQPGAAAFIDHFRKNDAFVVSKTEKLTISGLPAMHVTIGGKPNFVRCPRENLYQYTPKTCDCYFIVRQGDTDSMYLVDVGADTFLFVVSPFDDPDQQSIVDSIRIPFTLPTQ